MVLRSFCLALHGFNFAWLGLALLGFAWLGFAWLGFAWLGLALLLSRSRVHSRSWVHGFMGSWVHGFALLGLALLGLAWLCLVGLRTPQESLIGEISRYRLRIHSGASMRIPIYNG